MPAYRQEDSQMTILNRLPRAGFGCSRGGCFENGNENLSTGVRVWAALSEQINNQNDRDCFHSGYDNGEDAFLQVGQAVSVNYGHRRTSANVVRKIPCSHSVELCLHDGAATRIVVNQHDVQILQNAEGYSPASQKAKGIACLDSWERPAPLVIDIPNYDDADFGSQDWEDAEEKMAAAVLTSLSLSPVLKNFQVEQDEMFEDAMNTDDDGAEISPVTSSDQEYNNRKSKLRRRKSSSKTVFQCIWPRCKKVLTNSSAIVRHVRSVHLGHKNDKEENEGDGEEEFYFIEVECNPDDTSEPCSEDSLSPPLTRTHSRRCRSFSDPLMPTQPPVSSTSLQRHVDDNFIWPLRMSGGRGKAKRPLHQTAHPTARKARGDGKKCRKVFGMENKYLWCTQCRWKKACVKFID